MFSSSMDVDVDNKITEPFVTCNRANESGFECNICLNMCQDPVVTLCGHLFCWPCLYQWLQIHFYSHECPVCKAIIEEEKLVPIYGRGNGNSNPKPQICGDVCIPKRPIGQRPPTAPPVQIHYFRQEEPVSRLSVFLGVISAIFALPGNVMNDSSVYGGNISGISFHGLIRLDGNYWFLKLFFLFLGIFVLIQMIF